MAGEENNDQQQQQQDQQQQAPQRPEYVPEKFWDPEKGSIRAEDAFKSYGELEKKLTGGKGMEGLTEELKAQIEGERLKNRPAKAEEYKLTVPEGALPEGVGFEFDEKHPLVGWWREKAFASGLSQADFDEGVKQFITGEVGKLQQTSEALVAEFEKLGESGKARVDFLTGRIASLAGESSVEVLAPFLKTAASVEAMEKILEATGGPKFSDIHKVENGAADGLTEAKLKEMKLDPRYWKTKDPAFIKQVDDGYEKLFGGQPYVGGGFQAA